MPTRVRERFRSCEAGESLAEIHDGGLRQTSSDRRQKGLGVYSPTSRRLRQSIRGTHDTPRLLEFSVIEFLNDREDFGTP
jgi:hypothetical protein